jgi:hypothetical protein
MWTAYSRPVGATSSLPATVYTSVDGTLAQDTEEEGMAVERPDEELGLLVMSPS